MNVSIKSFSDDKLIVRLTGKRVNSQKLQAAIDQIKNECRVRVERHPEAYNIKLERRLNSSDPYETAGTLLAAISTKSKTYDELLT